MPPESYVAGEQMLIRAALPGNAFGLLWLFSVIEKQEIPENLRGKVVLVATDVLVAGSGGRYVACGDWSGYDREWILFVRGLGFDFSPRYHVVRLG